MPSVYGCLLVNAFVVIYLGVMFYWLGREIKW